MIYPNFKKTSCRIYQIIVILVVNLNRTVASAKFICCCWRNPWCDFHVTHTPKCRKSANILGKY